MPVSELLLQWIWKNRLYEPHRLRTLTGEAVEVKDPGSFYPQGPDFQGVQILIGDVLWIGSVEIDMEPSLWYAHAHHENPTYRSVVLHVVWKAGQGACTHDIDGREVPIVALAPAVRETILERLYPKGRSFPCAGLAQTRSAAEWHALYDKWGELRLRGRHQSYRDEAEMLQAFWRALLYSFGVPDGAPYREIADALPWAILNRYAESLLLKEAALLGVAGLLESVSPSQEPYERSLLETWRYLQQKLGWRPLALKWRTSRPTASPWLRLAQLAALIQGYPTLLGLFLHPPADLPLPSPYWQQHWAWQRPLTHPLRRFPPLLYQNILINAIYPFAIYYLRSIGRIEEALEVVERFRRLPPENHTYARLYARYAYPAENAWQTQGILQLWREACQPQACLSCPIGIAILKP